MLKSPFSHKHAESIAVNGLGFIAAEPDYLSRFIGLTGIDAGDIRAVVNEPAFLTAILDFLMGDEKILVEFSKVANINPEHVAIARQILTGLENFEG